MKVKLASHEEELGIVYNNELIAIYQKIDNDIDEQNNKSSYKVKLIWN